MTPAEVLSKARDVLAEKGWCQGQYETSEGVCVLGALQVAIGGEIMVSVNDPLYLRAKIALMRALSPETPINWNDAPERSYEDIVLTLKRAEELVSE